MPDPVERFCDIQNNYSNFFAIINSFAKRTV